MTALMEERAALLTRIADVELVVTHLAGVVGAALKQVGMRVELASDVRMALGRIKQRIDEG